MQIEYPYITAGLFFALIILLCIPPIQRRRQERQKQQYIKKLQTQMIGLTQKLFLERGHAWKNDYDGDKVISLKYNPKTSKLEKVAEIHMDQAWLDEFLNDLKGSAKISWKNTDSK